MGIIYGYIGDCKEYGNSEVNPSGSEFSIVDI